MVRVAPSVDFRFGYGAGLALPALWVGSGGAEILQSMTEAVGRIVPLDVSYVAVPLLPEQPPITALRVGCHGVAEDGLAPWRDTLDAWQEMPHGSARMLHQTPAGKLQVVRLSLEYGSRGGSVWFGSADADDSAWVVGDAGRLTQVFANLLNNAAKYTDPGGRICIEAELEREHIRVCIRDNGAGMSSEMIPRMFGIFEQGSSTIGRARGGQRRRRHRLAGYGIKPVDIEVLMAALNTGDLAEA